MTPLNRLHLMTVTFAIFQCLVSHDCDFWHLSVLCVSWLRLSPPICGLCFLLVLQKLSCLGFAFIPCTSLTGSLLKHFPVIPSDSAKLRCYCAGLSVNTTQPHLLLWIRREQGCLNLWAGTAAVKGYAQASSVQRSRSSPAGAVTAWLFLETPAGLLGVMLIIAQASAQHGSPVKREILHLKETSKKHEMAGGMKGSSERDVCDMKSSVTASLFCFYFIVFETPQWLCLYRFSFWFGVMPSKQTLYPWCNIIHCLARKSHLRLKLILQGTTGQDQTLAIGRQSFTAHLVHETYKDWKDFLFSIKIQAVTLKLESFMIFITWGFCSRIHDSMLHLFVKQPAHTGNIQNNYFSPWNCLLEIVQFFSFFLKYHNLCTLR